ncbi:MAG: diacylglycerol kinase family protein [Anaerolineaceae bacterium]|nr:diacylglycerol kinase family protein [Anaerolineaceae bacterium]
MKPIDSIGVIINPRAGRGFTENARVAVEVIRKFPNARIVTGPGETGAAVLWNAAVDLQVCDCDPTPGRLQTISLARKLVEMGIDLLLVIGGDGTFSDVAFALAGVKQAPPMIGIGAGSTNVGPLVTCHRQTVADLDPARFEITSPPAIMVSDGQAPLGMGFNDCALGFTVVGTREGQICDVDAAAKMQGKNIPGRPRSIGTPELRVERIGAERIVTIASGAWISCVIIGLAERAFLGKGVTGGVCLAAYTGAPAGCLVASIPLVQVEISREELLQLGPIDTRYVSFDASMAIQVQGACDGAAINADGTPLKILSSRDRIRFTVVPEAVQVVRLK